MGFIIIMDGGAAYDGVYANESDAKRLCEALRLDYGHRHGFRVKEAPEGFTMRENKRIFWLLKQEQKKARQMISREYANGYRDALNALWRMSDPTRSPELFKAWDKLDTAWTCRVARDGIKD